MREDAAGEAIARCMVLREREEQTKDAGEAKETTLVVRVAKQGTGQASFRREQTTQQQRQRHRGC